MATIQDRAYSAEYSGLLSNIYVSVAVAAVCSVGYEAFRHTRRRRGDPRKAKRPRDDASRESWEFGYLYQARCWSRTPSPPLPFWPFAWAWAAIWFPEEKMPLRCGVDATVHVRYLRACLYYLALQTISTLPVLLPLHISYSPKTISNKSMIKASLSSLILTDTGRHYLWVHLVVLLWLLVTWVISLVWLSWGSIRYRRSTLHHTLDAAMKAASISPPADTHPLPFSSKPYQPSPLRPSSSNLAPTSQPLLLRVLPSFGDEHEDLFKSHVDPLSIPLPNSTASTPRPREPTSTSTSSEFSPPSHIIYTPDQKPILNEGPRGWRFRSIIVTNIPPDMREEGILRAYFEEGCSRFGLEGGASSSELSSENKVEPTSPLEGGVGAGLCTKVEDDDDAEEPFITEVVVIRRMLELEKLRERRMDVLKRLELAHVVLVGKVMAAVRTARERRVFEETGKKAGIWGKCSNWRETRREGSEEGMMTGAGELEKGKGRATASGRGGEEEKGEAEDWRHLDVSQMTKREKRDLLLKVLGRFLDEETCGEAVAGQERTIWEMLHALPRALLDPYQPLTHLTSLFRNQNAPLIDYLAAKLNLLTSLIEEQTSRPVSSFAPSSTAFVTFRNPKIARLVRKKMGSHPRKRLACDVAAAPDFRDLDWVRLMRNTYRIEVFRSWVVALGVWAFTVIWIIPITLFVTLTSIANIAAIIPALDGYLNKHPKTASTLTSLIPTLLVSILTLLIPLILLIISKQAETITTKSELHNVIGNRFYRFLICNVVIFFCIGVTSLQSFIVQFRNKFLTIDLLQVIASSFPQAAPFYAGWLILQTSLTSFFENFMFGLPLLFYLGIRASKVPRQRDQGLEPRFWNYFYWSPVHTVSLGIVVLFAILNPLVIPFGLIYFACAYPIFKNQLLHVYQHQYETQGTRPTIRFLRYTLDGHVLAQIVFLAMMVILQEKALIGLSVILIVITLAVKILLTRGIKSRFATIALEEAEGLYAISRGRAPTIRRATTSKVAQTEPPPPQQQDHHEVNSSEGHGSVEIAQPPPVAASASMGRFAPWRMRAGEVFHPRFSYSTVPRRRDSVSLLPLRRKPVPFDVETASMSSQSPFISVPSRIIAPLFARFDHRWQRSVPDLAEPGEEEGAKEKEEIPPPMEEDPRRHEEDKEMEKTKEVPLVQSRKSPELWDDTPHDGRRYGFQPAYVDPLPLALWLPRHPLRTLDLENTIELSRSLETSLGGSGRIGAWGTADEVNELEDEDEVVGPKEDYLNTRDAAATPTENTELDMLGALRDSPIALESTIMVSRSPSSVSRVSPSLPMQSPSKSSSTSLTKHPRLNGTERINLAALMAEESSSDEEDEAADRLHESSQSQPGTNALPLPTTSISTSASLARSKTSILARPKPKGARSPRAGPATSSSAGRRLPSLFSSPSIRSPSNSNSLAVPAAGGAAGRDRSNSAVSVKDALIEEIMAEEREARTKERKEERELTEKEGGRLKRGGSTMLRALGVMN